jgi:hypothetical protein
MSSRYNLFHKDILDIGGNAENHGPFKGNPEYNCYSMFRANSVDLMDHSSVGFGPIVLKFGRNATNEVPHEKNSECNCYSMFRAEITPQFVTFSLKLSKILLLLNIEFVQNFQFIVDRSYPQFCYLVTNFGQNFLSFC